MCIKWVKTKQFVINAGIFTKFWNRYLHLELGENKYVTQYIWVYLKHRRLYLKMKIAPFYECMIQTYDFFYKEDNWIL